MSAGDYRPTPKVSDVSVFVDSLADFNLPETALDQQSTSRLVEQCLAKFDDPEATLECRAIALYTLIAQITEGNPSMPEHFSTISDRFRSPTVLGQSDTEEGAEDYHREILAALGEIIELAPDKLVNDFFGPTMSYLVRLVSCTDMQIAVMACEFWVKYAGVPKIPIVRQQWMKFIEPEMPLLIKSFMEQMIYRPAHSEHLEQMVPCSESRASSSSLPSDIELLGSVRNMSALAVEHIADVYPAQLVCGAFRPILQQWIVSEVWQEKEAAILTLVAFTESGGTPDVMTDCYPIVIPRILECYSDQHPLLRSIACFAMPKLVGRQLRGVKDPWSRVLTATAKATRDSCAEVRGVALRALCTLLAYKNNDSGTGLQNHAAKLVDALIRARQCAMDTETRCSYFECVSHLVGRVSASLSPADMEQLIPPFLEVWKAHPWNNSIDGEKDGIVTDSENGFVPYSMALATVATYGGPLFAPYADSVFEKASTDIEEIVSFAASTVNPDEAGKSANMPPAMTGHMISCLDLLSAHYDGLGAAASPHALKHRLLPRLHLVLTTDSLDHRIYESTMALLGHILGHAAGATDPSVDEFLQVIRPKLEADGAPAKLRSNSLWALVHAALNPTASDEQLMSFVELLVSCFKRVNDAPRCIINSAWALTTILAPRCDQPAAIEVVGRRDVFLHLAGLLRATFPRQVEKRPIFSNVCRMLLPAVSKVPGDCWPVFLSALAAADQFVSENDGDLHSSIRSVLRELRTTVGNTVWSRMLQDVGTQTAALLRRRYRL